MEEFVDFFKDKPGLSPVAWHEIDMGSTTPVAGKHYRYNKDKQEITDYIRKMLADGIIMPIGSLLALPVVMCRKNKQKSSGDPEAWRFTIDYRKLNAVTQYPQFPIPVTKKNF